MLDSVMDVFRGTVSTSRGFGEEENETPEGFETKEINNSEGVEYSEVDIERIETAGDIMGEIFTDEVISNWENLSVEERTSYLNEYYAKAGQALGLDTKGVYTDDLYAIYGYGTQGVNSGDGYLGIDVRLVSDPSQLEELLNTTTHEMRHQLQNDALRNPDAFPDIPKETLERWQYEMNNYIDPSYDFEGYQNQVIETDARAFAEEVVNDFVDDAGSDTYAMERTEAEIPEEVVAGEESAADQIEVMSTEASVNYDGTDVAKEASEMPDVKAEAVQADGLEIDKDLNKNTFSYTAGQCARMSTGTQNYCIFGGSGR